MAKYPSQKHIDLLDRAGSHLRAVLDEVPDDHEGRRTIELALERTEQAREAAADAVHAGPSGSADTPLEVAGSISPEGGKS